MLLIIVPPLSRRKLSSPFAQVNAIDTHTPNALSGHLRGIVRDLDIAHGAGLPQPHERRPPHNHHLRTPCVEVISTDAPRLRPHDVNVPLRNDLIGGEELDDAASRIARRAQSLDGHCRAVPRRQFQNSHFTP
jgi:hypothetical protein